MKLFLILADTRGAHETDDLMSVWTTREAAEAEVARMDALRETYDSLPAKERKGVPQVSTTYGGEFSILMIEADQPSNCPLN